MSYLTFYFRDPATRVLYPIDLSIDASFPCKPKLKQRGFQSKEEPPNWDWEKLGWELSLDIPAGTQILLPQGKQLAVKDSATIAKEKEELYNKR